MKVSVCVGVCILASMSISAQGPASSQEGRAPRRITIDPFGTEISKEQRKKLSVGPEEAMRHARVLSMPDSGIFRLVPDPGCFENPRIVKAAAKCLEAVPVSPFYSFRKRDHVAEAFADIRLSKGNLITDPVRSQGLMAVLGEMPLEEVSLETNGISFIRDYVPKTLSGEVQRQFDQLASGLRSGGFVYGKAFPAVEGNTYALRVVAYRGSMMRSYRGFRVDLMSGDRRFDILVAFRIVGRDDKGALTIVWRQLERKSAPTLKIQRRS